MKAKAAAAAGDDEPELAVGLAEALEQRRDLRLEVAAVHGQLDRGGRALEAVEVLAEREGRPPVEADHLEDPVAAQQPVVPGRDPRVSVSVIEPSTLASSGAGIAARLSERCARPRLWPAANRFAEWDIRPTDACQLMAVYAPHYWVCRASDEVVPTPTEEAVDGAARTS